MSYQHAVLRGAAGLAWGATIGTAYASIGPQMWACLLTGSGVLSLTALQQALVGARLDRAYIAMARAFIREQTPAPTQAQAAGRHRAALTVVPGPGKAAP